MVARRDLNAPPGRRLADIVRKLREESQSGHTGAPGIVDLGAAGDVVWTGTDANGLPVEHSVKRFQVDLDDTTERAAQLEADLAQAEQDITAAKGRLDTAEQELGALDTRVDTAEGDISLAAQAAAAADAKAVAAQQKADAAQADADAAEAAAAAIRADLGNGPSLWEDPGFERTQGGVPSLATGRIERSQDWAASGTWSIRYTATGSGGNNYGSYGYVPATAGRWYMVTVTVHAGAHEQCINTTWDARTTPTNTGADLIAYLLNPGETIVQPGETKTSTWFFQAPAGTKYLRYWIGQHSHANTADKVGQLVYLDDFRLVDVTDSYPKYLEAKQAADSAASAAAAAMAEARYAPRIANRAPTAADGTSKPTGAGWLQYDSAGKLIQMWRWSGTAWERLDMDPVMIPVIQIGTGTAGDLTADRVTVTSQFVAQVAQIIQLDVSRLVVTQGAVIDDLVAQAFAAATADIQQAYIQNLRTNGATIDEAVIGDLAANIITSGLFRTAATGQRLEIDSNGLVMYGVNADGVEYEMVRLGPSGSNLMTIGQTTVAPDSVSSPEVNAGTLNVGGRSLASMLADLPQGVVAWGRLTQDSNYDSSTAGARRAEIQCYLEPDRLYRFSANQHFVNTTVTTGARLVEKLKWSLDSTPIFVEDSAGVTTGTSGRYYLENSAAYTIPPQSCIVDTTGWSARRVFWGMHLMYSEGSAPIRLLARSDYPLTLMVEDLGPSKPAYLKRWNDNNEGGSQDPGPAPVQRYVKTYTSTGYRCYNLDGTDAGRPDVVHGLYSGGPSNFRRRGGWLFPSMTGDLSGATVEKVEMYISCTQTHYSTGSTVNPAVWGGVMASGLSAFTSVYGWKAGTSKWITLPSSLYGGFKSGQYAGVGVIPTSSSAEQYARFAPNGAQIRITYTK